MKILATLCFILLMLDMQSAYPQDSKILAKSEYMAAVEAYNKGEWNSALSHLDFSVEAAGNNYLIQSLRVKIYYANKKWEQAKKGLETFFEITDDKYASTPEYNEMVRLVSVIQGIVGDRTQAVINLKSIIEDNIDIIISSLVEVNSVNYIYQPYDANRLMKQFKNYYYDSFQQDLNFNELVQLVDSIINENIPTEALNNILFDRRQLFFYKTLKIGNQTWMAHNVVNTGLSGTKRITYKNDTINQTKYGSLIIESDLNSICPEGWKVPSSIEWEALFSTLLKTTYNGNLEYFEDPNYKIVSQLESKNFHLQMGGYYHSSFGFNWEKERVLFWTSDGKMIFIHKFDDNIPRKYYVKNALQGKYGLQVIPKIDGYAYCRCIKSY